MGAAVSNWRLARAVSRTGQLGVVSGTGLDQVFGRRLQDGDPEGHIRRALNAFPFREMAQRLLDAYFIPGGKPLGTPYKPLPMHVVEGGRRTQEMCIAANFVEVFLAREGHTQPVGINYLEKIQLPHLPSLYGAMLAGVAVVIMGAGIPVEIPGVLDALARHAPVSYPVQIGAAAANDIYRMEFDPGAFKEGTDTLAPLLRPDFLPIVAADALATMLWRRSNGAVAGFIVEGPRAGGHNAPPRGPLKLTGNGQPIYGPRDVVDLSVMRHLGVPFWLAGCYGSPERLRAALAEGAAGVQVGTAFALCVESGLTPELRQALVRKALDGDARVFTDPAASPTGFPFKVAQLEGTLSAPDVYQRRRRSCDLGFLRKLFRRANGSIGYRCPAEPEAAYLAKGGQAADSVGRKCLCNALTANVGLAQLLDNGSHEQPLLTLGDDFADVGRFCRPGQVDYTAEDVIRILLAS
ncbi:MAG: nitronate monooxygenase [Kiritimatiellae bacterium]|nr:nitronate monooxygenase [Kiritimatiellia bacterium]